MTRLALKAMSLVAFAAPADCPFARALINPASWAAPTWSLSVLNAGSSGMVKTFLLSHLRFRGLESENGGIPPKQFPVCDKRIYINGLVLKRKRPDGGRAGKASVTLLQSGNMVGVGRLHPVRPDSS